jgi:hypothetical protein
MSAAASSSDTDWLDAAARVCIGRCTSGEKGEEGAAEEVGAFSRRLELELLPGPPSVLRGEARYDGGASEPPGLLVRGGACPFCSDPGTAKADAP